MTLAFVPHPDTELIARIRAGDERAFEELFRRYRRELCVYAARIEPAGGLAEEAVQEVFFRIWEHRDRLAEVQSLAGYLYAAVRNYALNQRARAANAQRWRQAKALELDDARVAAPAADAEVRSAEMAVAIDRAISELPPRCRQAFLLRRQEHRSYAEIASIMQITPKTVEIQIGNALKALRKALAEWM
jgi:RNA polymerase sigma-70 factor (ECF subfamily)